MNPNNDLSIHVKCKQLIKRLHIEWQYPVITELTVYMQQKNNERYIGLPWATIIDKRLDLNYIYQMIVCSLDIDPSQYTYTTSCQHVSYKYLIPLFVKLGITHLYISHKIKGLHTLDGVHLYPTFICR